MTTFLVTSGAGFIGSHLVDELATAHEVTIIDDLSTGRRENIRHLLEQKNAKKPLGPPPPSDVRTLIENMPYQAPLEQMRPIGH